MVDVLRGDGRFSLGTAFEITSGRQAAVGRYAKIYIGQRVFWLAIAALNVCAGRN